MMNIEDRYAFSIITTYSMISSILPSILLFYLYYYNSIYDVGNHTTYFVPMFICIAELIKIYLRTYYNDSSQSARDRGGKKSYMKVKMKEIIKSIFLIFISVVIYYIIAVLFGAEFFSKYEETLMLSILVTSLTIVPSCLNLGFEETIGFIIGKYTPADPISDMLLQTIHFTIIGTWMGAIPIPLDWDRPWQKWPITCYIGALLGYYASHVFSLIKLFPTFFKMYTGKSLRVGKVYNVKSKI